MENLRELCEKYEHYETDQWAAEAILEVEMLTRTVVDPCCGTGVLTKAARSTGADALPYDIHDWGFEGTRINDWLQRAPFSLHNTTVFMNPPYSKAREFVEAAILYGARKIITFQRFAWYESGRRRNFWDGAPPNRIYVCGDRATCWRHDVPPEDRLDENGREKSSPTANAWYVWERGHPVGTLTGRIYKPSRQW